MLINNNYFNLFIKECKIWIEKFGLYDWEVNYILVKEEDIAFASVSHSLEDKCAVIKVYENWEICETEEEIMHQIKKTALHEILELLLIKLGDLADNRKWDEEEYNTERHSVIRRLEKVLGEI